MRQNCTCELSLTDQNQTITIYFQRFNNQISSVPSNSDCGLNLKFSVGQDIFGGANCFGVIYVSKPIVKKNVITITSMTLNGTLHDNEGYCIEIKKVAPVKRGMLSLTCGIGSTTTTQTTTKSAESSTITTNSPSTTTMTTTTVSTITTTMDTDQFTSAKFTRSDSPESTKQVKQHQIISDNDDTTVLAAGGSVAGFVIIIGVIVVVCIYRRYHQKPIPKQGPAFDNESDDYGMRNNVLYVSSQSTDTAKPQDTKRISVDIDGNYSTVDLDEILSVEESTGDYSAVDLEKLTPSKSNTNGSTNEKPIIAPKLKQKMTMQDDIYSVPDKKRVKHVTAPDANGCEYAVVIKPDKSNVDKSEVQSSTSNVYAVVKKTKRMSDGKGTNQKRNSLTAENDGESGQS
ncbi:uncharacterized protein LOC127725438 [Mytilus californianus]|uniref:uncharacterized protein LOC127725438 n=1 Tax=Mytilus californianus TaxID=6549 RepID=UPI0022467370|nr:uncharacterized protein LOC127725438 [Mytilus californianus]